LLLLQRLPLLALGLLLRLEDLGYGYRVRAGVSRLLRLRAWQSLSWQSLRWQPDVDRQAAHSHHRCIVAGGSQAGSTRGTAEVEVEVEVDVA
jgi:hypothetical protein